MDKTKTPEKIAALQTILDNMHVRKRNKQYEILKAWDKGELTGTECIELIEEEAKILRLESDLMVKGKTNG